MESVPGSCEFQMIVWLQETIQILGVGPIKTYDTHVHAMILGLNHRPTLCMHMALPYVQSCLVLCVS